jgi:5'-nucleotidase
MPELLDNKLVIAISSRALFDLSASHEIYQTDGLKAYVDYQIAHEDTPLAPGDAFPLVEKLLKINALLSTAVGGVEIVLLSRNSADTGLRIFNSIQHYGLDITRAAFCSGESPYRYVASFGCHLFLSTHAEDVRQAIQSGFAAATILSSKVQQTDNLQLRIAFDGDAVLFSDEAEQVFQQDGLKAFTESEQAAANEPLKDGPFKAFLMALQAIQAEFSEADCPIRTALITARSAPTHERVIKTLRAWNIRIDESVFLGGLDKGQFLKAFEADVFFDDQEGHCESARQHVATGHVPAGIKNKTT